MVIKITLNKAAAADGAMGGAWLSLGINQETVVCSLGFIFIRKRDSFLQTENKRKQKFINVSSKRSKSENQECLVKKVKSKKI